eukprot:TRINITY_DN15692_c0_g1_i1.p1 TRINITY_DN15692_c0_g1~~TRINITY_DN15692_c0_g1_i1.p1  ORF type:complete len:571 (+),score=48.77 TRINITY_DN15692_c0_g1_i1:40-1713(+)
MALAFLFLLLWIRVGVADLPLSASSSSNEETIECARVSMLQVMTNVSARSVDNAQRRSLLHRAVVLSRRARRHRKAHVWAAVPRALYNAAVSVGYVLVMSILVTFVSWSGSSTQRSASWLKQDVHRHFKENWGPYCCMMSSMALQMMTTDQYLPNMPQMQHDFDTTPQVMALSLQINWLFKGFSSVVAAGLADRYGRKPLLIMSSLYSLVGSLTCGCSSSVSLFISGRVLQGIAESGEVVVMMLIRDAIPQINERLAFVSSVSTIVVIVPVIAPILGGMIGQWFDWRASFYLLSIWAAFNSLVIDAVLPETMADNCDQQDYRAELKRALSERHLMALVLINGLASVVMSSVDSNLPHVLEVAFNQDAISISLKFALLVMCCILGGGILQLLSKRVETVNILRGAMVFAGVPILGSFSIGCLATSSWQPMVGNLCVVFFTLMLFDMTNRTLYFQPVKEVTGAAAGLRTFGTMMFTSPGAAVSSWIVTRATNPVQALLFWTGGLMCACCVIFWPAFGVRPPEWAFSNQGAVKSGCVVDDKLSGQSTASVDQVDDDKSSD